MTQTIQEYADRIKSHLTSLDRTKVIQRLRKGLSDHQIQELTDGLPIQPPREVQELYANVDGTQVDKGDLLDDLHFFPGYYLLSLGDAVSSYNTFRNDERWHRSWLPLFANGGGDFCAIRCGDSYVENGEIVGFMLGEMEQPVEFESLAAMLATLDACYSENVFFTSPDGYLETDDLKQAKIAKRFNPSVELY